MPTRSPQDTTQRIVQSGALLVIRTSAAEEALNLAMAVHAGGMAALEVSVVTPGALEVVRSLRGRLGPEVLIGAGTVLDPETARMAILAGADFLVSPVFDPGLVRAAHRYGVAFFGGALTPTEILAAWEGGCDLVKVFPADAVGGPAYIKALRAPLPQVLLAPTGGVGLENAESYLRAGAAVLGVGSSLASPELARRGALDEVSQRCRALSEIVRSVRSKPA